MQNIRLMLLSGVIALILICALFYLITPQEQTIQVKENLDYKETVYSVGLKDDGKISLTVYHSDLNKKVLRLRSDSTLPLNDQIKIVSTILDRVLKDHSPTAFDGFSLGRLVDAFGKSNTQMSERLAIAAFISPKWDKVKGEPVIGYANNLVTELANTALIYPELDTMFKAHGLNIKVVSVEKVLSGKPDMTPFGESLLKQGVKPNEKLPFDCQTWFSITPVK
ncbi:MAG: hypothetical protein WCT39_01210 [Candidatus Margulisiibacteriota bacterium]